MKKLYFLLVSLFLFIGLQAQVEKTIESTAGQLNTLLSPTELTTITHLTVTGTMDARDIGMIKVEMPVLSVLDISRTKIIEYDENNPANSIPDQSFREYTSLTSIILPFSVVHLGREAFLECPNLEKVILPHSLKTIGREAFSGCASLTALYSYAVQPPELGPELNWVFENTDLAKCVLYVPEGSKELYAKASQWRDFENITEMPGIILSTSAITLEGQETTASLDLTTELAWEASSDQSWLTATPLSGTGNQQIALTAQENTDLTTRRATVTFAVSDTLQYEVTVVQKGLPVTVDMDAPGTFSQQLTSEQLSTLSELVITGPIDARDFTIIRDQTPLLEMLDLRGASIEAYSGVGGTFAFLSPWDYPANELPDMALQDEWLSNRKVKLTTLYLPESCTSVGREALANCIGLTEVIFPPSVMKIGFMAFSNCESLKSVELPSVTTIDAKAFEECQALTNLQMPAVTDIGEEAFSLCTKLPSVVLPETLTRIGIGAFTMCFELTSVEMGNSVTTIREEAFFECHNLQTVNIPKSVTHIGYTAFYNCVDLQSIYAYPEIPIDLTGTDSWGVFAEVDTSTCILYVPFGTKELYEQAAQWQDFTHIVERSGFELSSTELTFGASSSVQSVEITTEGTWTATSDKDWLTASPASGDTTQTITITVLENDASEPRTGTILFSGPDSYAQILTITQHSSINSIPVANAGADQSAEEDETVQLDGSASSDADNDTLTYQWTAPERITLSSASDAKPTFTAPKVQKDTILTFILMVNDGKENSPTDEVLITITNKTIELGVSARNVIFESRESSAKIRITGNAQWTAISDKDWLSITPLSGEGQKEITLTAQANDTSSERVATVTVSAPEVEAKTITVTQRALTTGVDELSLMGITYYPNPFTTELAITVANPSLKEVSVEIYSISGQRIKTLAKAQKGAKISLTWDSKDEQGKKVPHGLYLLKVNGQAKKVVFGK